MTNTITNTTITRYAKPFWDSKYTITLTDKETLFNRVLAGEFGSLGYQLSDESLDEVHITLTNGRGSANRQLLKGYLSLGFIKSSKDIEFMFVRYTTMDGTQHYIIAGDNYKICYFSEDTIRIYSDIQAAVYKESGFLMMELDFEKLSNLKDKPTKLPNSQQLFAEQFS